MAASGIQKTSNPAFSPTLMRNLSRQPRDEGVSYASDTVSIGGAALKSVILLMTLMVWAGAVMAYSLPTTKLTTAIPPELIACLIVGTLGGFAMAMYTIFVPSHSPYTAPVYAVLEGLAIGGISAATELAYPGIV